MPKIPAPNLRDNKGSDASPDMQREASYDAAAEARRLLRNIRAGALATLDPEGNPFASLVNVATDFDGSPLFLLSQLAGHTQHLEQRPQCSLLLTQTGKGDPLAHPRLTVMGMAHRVADPRLRKRFLARHPKSALYADFADFSFWRLTPNGFHLNGGFARAMRFAPEAILTDIVGAHALIAIEADAVAHLNQDHAEALRHYAIFQQAANTGAPPSPGPWRATGVDPDGLDAIAGLQTERLVFYQRVIDEHGLRAALAKLAGKGPATDD